MNNDYGYYNNNDEKKEQDPSRVYMDQLTNSTQMLHSVSDFSGSSQTTYNAWDETEESVRSYYQILSIALLAGFAVNFLTAKFFAPTINATNPLAILAIYVVCAIIGCIVLNRSETFTASIVGYALLVVPLGISITPAVTLYYSPTIVSSAFMGTTVIAAGMLALSYLYPNAFLSMGRTLFMSLLLSLIGSVVCALVAPGALDIIDYAVVMIFGLYIGYDVARARTYPRTPQFAMRAAADLYLDLINIFLRLLRILGKNRD